MGILATVPTVIHHRTEAAFFPSREMGSRLERKSGFVLDVEEATGKPRLVAGQHITTETPIGLFVGNNPISGVDPLGLITVGFYGAGGNTVGNAAFGDMLSNLGGTAYDRTQQNQALNAITAAKQKCPNEPVNILGYSRGSQAANQLSQKLNELGINVDTLNVIDPVTIQGQPMHLTVPSNVQEANDYYQNNHSFMLNPDHPFQGGAFNNPSYNPNVNSVNMSYPGVNHNTIVSEAAQFINVK